MEKLKSIPNKAFSASSEVPYASLANAALESYKAQKPISC
jgi:hypothetical protein